MKYLKTFENIQRGHDVYLIMTDDEKYYLTTFDEIYNGFAGRNLLLKPVEELKVEDFSKYAYTDHIKKVIDDANKPKYIIDSIVDDSDIFKVIKYHKEKNKTLVKLLKPLKPVKFFMGAYQSDDIKFG